MRRENCSACGSVRITQIIDLGLSPVADAYESTLKKSMNAPKYPLEVAVCEECYLVQLLEILPQSDLFGTGYSFYTSASPPLSAYHEDYFKWVCETFDIHDDERYVLEIGCNDGDLLRHFKNYGFNSIGVDPATGPVNVARTRGLNVYSLSFDNDMGDDIRSKHGPAQLVIANHVLAHVEDVSDFLAGISAVMDETSLAIIEVQYVADLLINNAFDLIYHEHRNFFSVSSLGVAALRHNLTPIKIIGTNRQGGSIRMALRKGDQNLVTYGHSEKWLQSLATYHGLQGKFDRMAERLYDLVTSMRGSVAGYGAPAKATTLLNFCNLGDDLLFVVDTTLAKQGRYIPGTRAKIIAPNTTNHPDTYLMLAWNYAREIIRGNRDFMGNWILPIPAPIVI